MKYHRPDLASLPSQLKQLVADLFRLDIVEADKISDYEPLIGVGLGVDSLDALDLALCIEEEFGITISSPEEAHLAFASITSLADFIQVRINPGISQRPHPVQRKNGWNERSCKPSAFSGPLPG